MKTAAASSYVMPAYQRAMDSPVTQAGHRSLALENRNAPPVHLTPRQREVLSLLCEGLPNKLICRRLNISTGTVKIHIGCIMRELGVSSRLQAVVSAQRCGLLRDFPGSAAQPADHDAAAQPSMMLAMLAPAGPRAGAAGQEAS